MFKQIPYKPYPRHKVGTDTFYWYVGHDPYNSLDNIAFMDRLTSKRTNDRNTS